MAAGYRRVGGNLGALFFLVILGCNFHHSQRTPFSAPPAIPAVVDSDSMATVQRVIIFPFENRTAFGGITQQVQARLAAEIRQSGTWEIVDVDPRLFPPCDYQLITRGEYPLQLLVDAYHRFNADAVLFGGVHEFRAYPPLSLGVTLNLVGTREGNLIGSLDHHWTTADRNMREAFSRYLRLSRLPRLQDEVLERSPAAFLEFTMKQVAEAWGVRARRPTHPVTSTR